ncbi:chitobiosyldiphosphodolichol beta-mannosyltransferase [Paecilomyces variotii No. 5]|uniref:Chitobiosyldiphosphodolichol beta-mannosyltransferase n=1 Tax=Byssochlamys spectabilis (strain No. 5 / NBRC 109023) TaxID=1356009 RepID=V5FM22_BYSSN|nr:chitobiosyldiphosphodolichol beta-mannosyltransferase [Paecilomyces variotii No. 5]
MAACSGQSRNIFPSQIEPLCSLYYVRRALRYSTWTPAVAEIQYPQNPPSIPTLAVASLVCFLRNTALVIDWHNFGYSILALKLGDHHPLVRISKSYETIMSRYATAHLCVTNAMARVLKQEFSVKAPILPLHDRPADHLRPIQDDARRLEFLLSLQETAHARTLLGSGDAQVLVSSTSWTADEDFSILIDALTRYSNLAASGDRKLPHILAIITGKGPQRDTYLAEIASLKKAGKLQQVDIESAWLSTQDYASLLASASLGVSLHTSSSGVDLPMKVVDMFGAGLPVVGWDRFEAWPELVTEGVNGRGFGSAEQLVEHLVDLFGNLAKLAVLREGALKEGSRRWDDEWDPIAGKLFELVDE